MRVLQPSFQEVHKCAKTCGGNTTTTTVTTWGGGGRSRRSTYLSHWALGRAW